MEGEWSCYRGGQFNGGRMVMLQRRFNGGSGYGGGQVEGEWSCYRGGHFNRENGHVTEVITLKKGEWSCYRGGQFKEGRMVMLQSSL